MHIAKPGPGKTQKADDLEKLDIWCASMLQIMQETVEQKNIRKNRREMIKAEMMGIDR